MPDPAAEHIEAVRRFNRFYTRRIGVLDEGLLASPWSLAQVRVLYELAHLPGTTARDLARDLALDDGYLSRILQGFVRRGLVRRDADKSDARQRTLTLTAAGHREFAPLDRRSQKDVAAMLSPLSDSDQARVAGAMQAIEQLLSPAAADPAPFVLRAPRPGDMGWVVQAHGEYYSRAVGVDAHFEALVARIVADFVEKFDATGERCWIAERDGERVGSVFVVRKSATVAKLRLLLVDPKARGTGLGKHLVTECIRFARDCGYRKMTLWTQRSLAAARGIYQQAGFVLVASETHAMFGIKQVSETWDLDLTDTANRAAHRAAPRPE